jgi:HD-like signal output (HDOD) protein
VNAPVKTGDAYRAAALESLDRLPPFSPVLNRLLATIARDDVSFAEVASLIENDAVLAGNVLKIVNSALYGFQGTVNSVRHGVAILGVNKLRNIALSLSVARMWTHARMPQGWSALRFNQHSMAVGLLADLIAQRSSAPYPEGAFVAGLLHDVGKSLLAVSAPEEYTLIQSLSAQTGRSEVDCELEVVGLTHAELSGIAMNRWNLPQPIELAAAHHHDPDLADEGRLHLSHVVETADRLANELSYSVSESRVPTGSAESSLEGLHLAEATETILGEFQMDFEVLKAFF